MEDLSKLKIADLKKKCKDSGLICTGNKAELLARLHEHLNKDNVEDTVLNEAELLGELDAADSQKSPVSNVDEDLLLGDSVSESKEDKEESDVTKAVELSIPENPKEDEKQEEPPIKVPKIDDKLIENGKGKQTELTPEERLKMRAARFESSNGTSVSAEDKMLERAKRFGLEIKSDQPVVIDTEKLKKREERFGVLVSDTLKKEVEEEKRKKRTERFGETKNETEKSENLSTVTNDSDDKKMKRAARFGLVSEDGDDKKKARAARFGLTN